MSVKNKNWSEIFLDDFCKVNELELNPKCKLQLIEKRTSILWRYFLDFFICHFAVGPATLLVWRGIWDFAGDYVQDGLLAVITVK